jgi:hypothetical protein
MIVSITYAPLISGSGKRPAPTEITVENYISAKNAKTLKEFCQNSRFVHIINYDTYCLLRATIIGQAYADKNKNWKNLKRPQCRELN